MTPRSSCRRLIWPVPIFSPQAELKTPRLSTGCWRPPRRAGFSKGMQDTLKLLRRRRRTQSCIAEFEGQDTAPTGARTTGGAPSALSSSWQRRRRHSVSRASKAARVTRSGDGPQRCKTTRSGCVDRPMKAPLDRQRATAELCPTCGCDAPVLLGCAQAASVNRPSLPHLSIHGAADVHRVSRIYGNPRNDVAGAAKQSCAVLPDERSGCNHLHIPRGH